MKIGSAVALFCNINTDKFNDQEKGQAIYEVLKMPTHNSISKDKMLSVIDYLLRLSFDLPDEEEK